MLVFGCIYPCRQFTIGYKNNASGFIKKGNCPVENLQFCPGWFHIKDCGEVFRRVHWNNRGKKFIVWRCVSRLENTGLFCDARTVLESTIEQVLVTAINQTLCDKDSFLITLRDNIATVINRESDKALADIDKRLEELQTELLKLAMECSGDIGHRESWNAPFYLE